MRKYIILCADVLYVRGVICDDCGDDSDDLQACAAEKYVVKVCYGSKKFATHSETESCRKNLIFRQKTALHFRKRMLL